MIIDNLKSIDIFQDLKNDLLEEIAKITTIKRIKKDNILFYEGEEPKYFYALISGKLKLYKTGIKANEIVLHYFATPTLIAEMAVLEAINFPASAVALQDDTKIAFIEKDQFISMLQNNSKFSFHIIKSLNKKLKHLEQTINRNLVFDATLKVCSLLKDDKNIFDTLKNKEIASILNMAPETISRTLKKLKKLGIIDENNKLVNEEKLLLLLEFN